MPAAMETAMIVQNIMLFINIAITHFDYSKERRANPCSKGTKDLADYVPYWCAQYAEKCDFLDYYLDNKLAGWQCTDSYNIDGHNYDLSVWY